MNSCPFQPQCESVVARLDADASGGLPSASVQSIPEPRCKDFQLPRRGKQVRRFLGRIDKIPLTTVHFRETLHQYLCDLYFMPTAPELKEVNAVLKLYQEGEYRFVRITLQFTLTMQVTCT